MANESAEMRFLFFICLAISTLFFACNEKKVNSEAVYHKTKWEDGSIKAEGYYINDTIKEGLFKRYYRNGKLEFEINYHGNKENGPYIKYFENEKKQFVFNYKDGLKSGVCTEYFDNGKPKFFQVYKVFHPYEHPSFGIDFLKNGEIKMVHGEPVVDRLVNKDTLLVGDTLRIFFQVAVPDSSKVLLRFYEDVAAKTDSVELKVNTKEGIAKYEKVVDKRGTMNWGGKYLIKLGKKDRINFDFKGVSVVR